MHFLTLCVLGALAAQTVAVPHPANHVVHERRDATSKAWIKRDRLAATVELPVRIGMTQSNLDKGHDLLMEV
jgi:tripeptidyl-peptidase-1